MLNNLRHALSMANLISSLVAKVKIPTPGQLSSVLSSSHQLGDGHGPSTVPASATDADCAHERPAIRAVLLAQGPSPQPSHS
jgi:hypothetical protein